MLEKTRYHRLHGLTFNVCTQVQKGWDGGWGLPWQPGGWKKAKRGGFVERVVNQIDDWIPDGALVYGAIGSVVFHEKYVFDHWRGDDVAAEDGVIVPLMDPAIKTLHGDNGDQGKNSWCDGGMQSFKF